MARNSPFRRPATERFLQNSVVCVNAPVNAELHKGRGFDVDVALEVVLVPESFNLHRIYDDRVRVCLGIADEAAVFLQMVSPLLTACDIEHAP